ncbi:putative 60S ribosomal protein L18a-like protein-like isoform X2 [Capsicum annuum]|nr:putative 60S ribosomal protein L18a-like protein-like isoform X2 [Capsicum annuum]
MSEEGGKMNRDTAAPATAIAVSGEPLLANYCYGTFQGVASYQSPPPLQSHPVFGFPQPIPPPAVCAVPPCYFPHGYQTVQVEPPTPILNLHLHPHPPKLHLFCDKDQMRLRNLKASSTEWQSDRQYCMERSVSQSRIFEGGGDEDAALDVLSY